jgi:hypothetical protein
LLDHRWLRVQELLAAKGATIADGDRFVQAAMAVLTPLSGKKLTQEQFSDAIREAIQLRSAADPMDRDTLEAWLLSGLDIDGIAEKTKLLGLVVQAYRDLFLDVVPWLDQYREELAMEVLPEYVYAGIEEDDISTWKRFVALQGGPFVLESYLKYLKCPRILPPSKLDHFTTKQLEYLSEYYSVRVYILSRVPLKTDRQRMLMNLVTERVQEYRR